MSTNFYLVNKRDKEINNSIDVIVKKKFKNLKSSLIQFSNENDLDLEDVIEDKLVSAYYVLDWGIYEIKNIHICRRLNSEIIWDVNDHFKDVKSFIDFYKKNSEIFDIESEYGEVFKVDDFLKMMEGFEIIYV